VDAESFIHIDRIAPIYNLTEGVSQRILPKIMFEASQRVPFEPPEFSPAPPRAVEAGEQAALMAPTQILAEQHALNLRRWLEPLGVRVDLFTGNAKNKKGDRLQGGELDLFA